MAIPPRRRNSLRYPEYDYSQPGGIVVTMVTHNRQRLFGELGSDDTDLSPAGAALAARWEQIPHRSQGVALDGFVIMPDHLHGILWFGTKIDGDEPTCGDVVRWLKNAFQRDYANGVAKQGWPRYEKSIWQRGFYDHIIRSQKDLETARNYIGANPYHWLENSSL